MVGLRTKKAYSKTKIWISPTTALSKEVVRFLKFGHPEGQDQIRTELSILKANEY